MDGTSIATFEANMATQTPVKTRATIFVNASSGWDDKADAPHLLEERFQQAGLEADIEYVQKGANLAEMSRNAVANGSDVVVAGGGDGTLSAVASGLVGTDVAFGVLPVGTLNHFARDLKIPLDLVSAAQVVLAGHSGYVDVAEVNGKVFLNNSIIGLYPIYRFVRARKEQKGWNRRLALLWAAAAVIWRYPTLRLRFMVEGKELSRRTAYVLIGNNRHAMEGWNLGSRDSLCEGKLWVYVLKPHGRWGLFRMLVKLLLNRFDPRTEFDIFSAEEVWIETRSRRLGVALDGEVRVMETPLHYRVLPRGLRVLQPTVS
jgi:diacylglycerol kinase family enzyme